MKKVWILVLLFLLILPGCDIVSFQAPPISKAEMIQFYEGETTSISKTVSLGGEDYQIELACADADEWGNFTRLKGSVNDASFETEVFSAYHIMDAYLADMEPGDEAVEFIFLIDEGSADLTLRAYQYTKDAVTPIPFRQFGTSEDCLLAGWNYDGCTLSEGGSLSLTVATPSYAMWGIKVNYRLEDGVLCAEETPHYEVNMEKYVENIVEIHALYTHDPVTEEKLMEGYFLVQTPYEILEEGDYVTVLYDDGADNIYVKTEDGTEGWIPIPWDYDLRERINSDFFFLAG